MSEPEIVTSPSGRYTLTITSVETKPGCWNYTHGVVTRADGSVISTVKRNYSSFDYEWIEDHPNSHDYLVCGEDYQGQTVIELDTAQRRDHLPPEAAKGHAFCWVTFEYNRAHKLMVVAGCYWAAPYEYRFYDFSDPMNGWPQLGEGTYFDADGKAPTLEADGTITTYETLEKGRIDGVEYLSEDYDETPVVVATRTVKREGLNLIEISSWIDEGEVARRAASKAAREEWDRKWAEYKATDPMFLRVVERASVPPFKNESYSLSTGVCYEGWHPTEKFDDARVCKRLLDKPRDENDRQIATGWTVDLEWGRTHAPVKLQVFKDGKYFDLDKKSVTEDRDTAKFFEHSVQGIDQAMDLALRIIEGK